MLQRIGDTIEYYVRLFVVWFTKYLPVKVIRDHKGRPFLYRYHLFSLYKDGPGMCIHQFVRSDPDRGYHDHPWLKSMSFILCGGYEERLYDATSPVGYKVKQRRRWQFNYLDGKITFHRVMIEPNKDAWTLFVFQKRSKLWGIKTLDHQYQQMSTTIEDRDGGWWYDAKKGLNVHDHVDHPGKVITTVDCVIFKTPNHLQQCVSDINIVSNHKNATSDCARVDNKDATDGCAMDDIYLYEVDKKPTQFDKKPTQFDKKPTQFDKKSTCVDDTKPQHVLLIKRGKEPFK